MSGGGPLESPFLGRRERFRVGDVTVSGGGRFCGFIWFNAFCDCLASGKVPGTAYCSGLVCAIQMSSLLNTDLWFLHSNHGSLVFS